MTNKKKVLFGVSLVLIGLILLGNSLDILSVSLGDILRSLVPLFFIGLGVWLIIRRKKMEDRLRAEIHMESTVNGRGATVHFSSGNDQSSASMHTEEKPTPNTGADQGGTGGQQFYSSSNYEQVYQSASSLKDGDGKLKYSKTIGDMNIDLNAVSVHDIEVSTGVGDLEIRLSGGVLREGLNRIIISGFVGDIRIYIPRDMPVFSHCSNFVGDVEIMGKRTSGFGNNIESQTPDYATASKKLYIACNSFIGDIRVLGV